MDCTVHGVTKSQTRLSGFHFGLLATPKMVLIVSYLVKSIFNYYILGYVSVTCYLWLIYSSW